MPQQLLDVIEQHLHTYSRIVQWMQPNLADRTDSQSPLPESVHNVMVKTFCDVVSQSENIRRNFDATRAGSLLTKMLTGKKDQKIQQTPQHNVNTSLSHPVFSIFQHGDTPFRAAGRELCRELFIHQISQHCVNEIQTMSFSRNRDALHDVTKLVDIIGPYWLLSGSVGLSKVRDKIRTGIIAVATMTPLLHKFRRERLEVDKSGIERLCDVALAGLTKICSYSVANGATSLNNLVEGLPRSE